MKNKGWISIYSCQNACVVRTSVVIKVECANKRMHYTTRTSFPIKFHFLACKIAPVGDSALDVVVLTERHVYVGSWCVVHNGLHQGFFFSMDLSRFVWINKITRKVGQCQSNSLKVLFFFIFYNYTSVRSLRNKNK